MLRQHKHLNDVKYGGIILDPDRDTLKDSLKWESEQPPIPPIIRKQLPKNPDRIRKPRKNYSGGGENMFWILNTNEHWTAVAKKGGEWFEIDSFNRDLLGSEFEDFKLAENDEQKIWETDCGQRTLASIYELF